MRGRLRVRAAGSMLLLLAAAPHGEDSWSKEPPRLCRPCEHTISGQTKKINNIREFQGHWCRLRDPDGSASCYRMLIRFFYIRNQILPFYVKTLYENANKRFAQKKHFYYVKSKSAKYSNIGNESCVHNYPNLQS